MDLNLSASAVSSRTTTTNWGGVGGMMKMMMTMKHMYTKKEEKKPHSDTWVLSKINLYVSVSAFFYSTTTKGGGGARRNEDDDDDEMYTKRSLTLNDTECYTTIPMTREDLNP